MTKKNQDFVLSLALTIGAILVINVLALTYGLATTDLNGDFSFRFLKGAFFINNELVGFKFGSWRTNIFMVLLFLSVWSYLKRRKSKKKEESERYQT